jgi:surface protein
MCKIKFENIQNEIPVNGKGTGFFCLINNPVIPFKKALFTANHVLNKNYLENEKSIMIEYLNESKTIEITPERKYFTNDKLDYTCIEIFDSDGFDSKYFFKIEPNIQKKSLKNQEIFILQYPMGGDLSFSSGKIIDIKENKISHSASTCIGSSGSPIIRRFDNNIVGLHFGSQKIDDNNYAYNYATSFDSILEDIKYILYNYNVIIAKFNIDNDNSEVKIINSYENSVKEGLILDSGVAVENEALIKKTTIFIDNKKLKNFEYVHKFQKKGEYTIRFKFHNLLNSTNYMFHKCVDIIELDLSNFNSSQVTNMCGMFEKCRKLKKIIFNNINTSNVKNMSWMFNECESLNDLDISNFKTKKVENMICMFNRCESLKNLNLSNLDAQNVINMICMFCNANL